MSYSAIRYKGSEITAIRYKGKKIWPTGFTWIVGSNKDQVSPLTIPITTMTVIKASNGVKVSSVSGSVSGMSVKRNTDGSVTVFIGKAGLNGTFVFNMNDGTKQTVVIKS